MNARVGLYVNCFERDYRQVLGVGFMKAKASQFRFSFESVVVTLNNIEEKACAVALAKQAVERGEINEYIVVEDALPKALEICGLNLKDLGLVRHYVDFALVAVTCAAPAYLLYCCAEVDLVTPFDWVTDAVAKMESDPRILVANPSWASDPEGAQRESLRRDGHYWLGQGFSDQCFLADAGRLAAPIYRHKHATGGRYPMSEVGDTFEKRVDAYMRHNKLSRISDSRAFYNHAGVEGLGYPKLPLMKRILRKVRRLIEFRKISSGTVAKFQAGEVLSERRATKASA